MHLKEAKVFYLLIVTAPDSFGTISRVDTHE